MRKGVFLFMLTTVISYFVYRLIEYKIIQQRIAKPVQTVSLDSMTNYVRTLEDLRNGRN